jgi:hypothetical protein
MRGHILADLQRTLQSDISGRLHCALLQHENSN